MVAPSRTTSCYAGGEVGMQKSWSGSWCLTSREGLYYFPACYIQDNVKWSGRKLSEITTVVPKAGFTALLLLRFPHCSGMLCVPLNVHFLSQELQPLKLFSWTQKFLAGEGGEGSVSTPCVSTNALPALPHSCTVAGISDFFTLERESTFWTLWLSPCTHYSHSSPVVHPSLYYSMIVCQEVGESHTLKSPWQLAPVS